MEKLFIDFTFNWLKYQFLSWKMLLSGVLLIVPISLILNLKAIETHFLSIDFTSIKNTEVIKQISIFDNSSNSPVDKFIFDEIHARYPYLVGMFERTLELSAKKVIAGPDQDVTVSFASSTLTKLDIDTHLGSLQAFGLATTGANPIAAVSFNYWKNNLNSDPSIVNQQIIVNGKSAKVIAVLNKGFISLRRDSSTDLLLPYHQLSEFVPSEQALTPDTFSYLIGDVGNVNDFIARLDKHLKEELFVFDNTNLVLSNSIGVIPDKFQRISRRVDLLSILFSVLLIFSLVSFSAFYTTQCINKKKEIAIRKLCGANEKHIIMQNYIEVVLLACYLLIMLIIFTPLTNKLAFLIVPTIDTFNAKNNVVVLVLLLLGFITLLLGLNYLQDKTTITHTGRGSSASLSEKVQVFTLLSFLISLAMLSIYISYLIIYSQLNLNNHNIGFKHKDISIATFDFPSTPKNSFMADDSAQQLILQLSALPYLDSVALTNVPPLSERSAFSHWYTVSGQPITSSKNSQTSNHRVSPNYFNTIGTRIIIGESLNWGEYTNIVINKALWERYFREEELGQAYLLAGFGEKKVKYKVVGVVENIHIKGSDTPVQPTIYTLISVITGFESIVLKYDKLAAINIVQEMKAITYKISPYLKNLTIVELSKLVKKENQPRVAILIVTITCSLVLIFSALLYCIYSIKQLASKSATEIALKRAIGARTKVIIWSLCKYFLFIFLITHFIVLTVYYVSIDRLKPFLFGVDLINVIVIITVHLVTLSLVIMVFVLETKKIINTSWNSLS